MMPLRVACTRQRLRAACPAASSIGTGAATTTIAAACSCTTTTPAPTPRRHTHSAPRRPPQVQPRRRGRHSGHPTVHGSIPALLLWRALLALAHAGGGGCVAVLL